MYERMIRPLLFMISIERAHRIVLVMLRVLGTLSGGRWLLGKLWALRHPALEREVFGIRFPNPIGIAAGFDTTGEACRSLAAMGFGFVEVGTVTPRPQSGNPRPRVFRLPKDRAIMNRIGNQNKGLERTIQYLRQPRGNTIVGCNIGRNTATTPEKAAADYLKLFRNLYQYADYFTVNVNCDNGCQESTEGLVEHCSRMLTPLFEFRRGQNQYRPILLKISPDLPDGLIDALTDLMIDTPLDGLVAVSGTTDRSRLKTSGLSLAKIGNGRLSGEPLTRRALEVVRRIHERSRGTYPIIGVGGIMSADDARAMLRAGASLVQIYTGFIYEGPRIIRDCCQALVNDAAAAEGKTEKSEN